MGTAAVIPARVWLNLDEALTDTSARRMPWGICSGCGEQGPLPPFGEGQCFLCATDGPAGVYTPAISALDEDADARRDELPEFDEDSLESQVRDIFNDARSTRARLGQSSWQNLEEDIADEFSPYVQRYDALDDAYERSSSLRRQNEREAQERYQEKERAAGRCQSGCGRPIRKVQRLHRAKPPRLCEECAAANRKRTAQRRAERQAAGRCRRGCGRPIRQVEPTYDGKPPARRPALCKECAALERRPPRSLDVAGKRERVAAGRCRRGCGRPIRQVEPTYRGRQPVLCEECAAQSNAGSRQTQADRVAAGRCRKGCGRPIRNVQRLHCGKPPTLCEECTAEQRRGRAQTWAVRDVAGRCRSGCGRPIRQVEPTYRGKPPILCEECTAKNKAVCERKHADKLATGRCRTGYGRPIRKVERPYRGKAPVLCEECTAKRKEQHARKQDQRGATAELARAPSTRPSAPAAIERHAARPRRSSPTSRPEHGRGAEQLAAG